MSQAGYSTGGINLTISANAQKSIDTLQKLNTTLVEINNNLKSLSVNNGLQDLNKNTKTINSDLEKSISTTDKLSGAMQKLGGVIGKVLAIVGLKRVLKNSFKEILEFTENYNMFSVAMSTKHMAKAVRFQNEMTQRLGSSMTETTRMQGFFMALSESLGIANEESYMLSENLTKVAYDLASLYNFKPNDMYSKLQSGLVGQTKPLRSVGIDVTQQSLQPLLTELGIEATVKELTQAEKVVLRYISIIRQSAIAHGDMALTIESPANQIRVLTAQIKELYRWIGATFIGLLGSILPYINAFVMALVQVFKTIALFLGFDVSDYDASSRFDDFGLEEMENTAGGVADNLGRAGANAKELRKQLAGFDEINNLNLPSSPSGGGGGGGGGGIGITDGKYMDTLLNAMQGYDNLMASVKTKAENIRDSIMDWLGFTKLINPETAETFWHLRDGLSPAKTLLGIVNTIGTVIKFMLEDVKNFFLILGIGVGTKYLIGVGLTWAVGAGLITKTSLIGKFLSGIAGLGLFKTIVLGIVIASLGVGLWKLLDNLFQGKPIEMNLETPLKYDREDIFKDDMLRESLYKKYNLEGMSQEEQDELLKKALNESGKKHNLTDPTYNPNQTNEKYVDALTDEHKKKLLISALVEKDLKLINSNLSESMRNILSAYHEFNIQSNTKLTETFYTGRKITQAHAKELKDIYDKKFMAIMSAVEEHYEQEYQQELKLINLRSYANEEDRQKDINNLEKNHRTKLSKIADNQARVREILDKASERNEALTREEFEEIQKIQAESFVYMLDNLTDHEDTKLALQRMFSSMGIELNKNTGLGILNVARQNYSKAIQDAEDHYNTQKLMLKKSDEEILFQTGLTRSEYVKMMYEQFNESKKIAGKELAEIGGFLGENIDDYGEWLTSIGIVGEEYDLLMSEAGKSAGKMGSPVEQLSSVMGTFTDRITRIAVAMGLLDSSFLNSEKRANSFRTALNNIPDNKRITITTSVVPNRSKVEVQGVGNWVVRVDEFRANGGFVSSGDVFVANENGNSEMIGRFGNQTAVANNMQIVDGISKGVYNAMMQVGGQQAPTIINEFVVGGTKLWTEVNRQIRKTAYETGEFPI